MKKHGMTKTPFYAIYCRMRDVCKKKTDKRYHRYGGRGIKLLWKNFEEFRDDMYESYIDHLKKHGKLDTTIERINNNRHYCKENCRWATRAEQAENRTSSKKITFDGKTLCIKNWAREYKIGYWRLWDRITNKGMTLEKALKNIGVL